MQRIPHTVQFKNAILHYDVTGNGEKTLLLFHGFGQNKTSFYELAEVLADRYTLYIVDLFFHGESEWPYGEQPLEKEFWREILEAFFRKHQIESFSVLGFSLGGKFALATLEAFPSKTNEIFLVAADGIKTNFWYSLATYPFALRKFFKSMILHPERFQLFTSLCNELGLVDKGIVRFAEHQMDTEEKRKRVYYSWVVFRHLKFDMNSIADLVNTHDIQTTIVIGKFDKLVTIKSASRLVSKLKTCKFEVLETGHNALVHHWTRTVSKRQSDSPH